MVNETLMLRQRSVAQRPAALFLSGLPALILHLAAIEAHSFSPGETGEAYDISATPK
jgi:hypothetical protein